MDLQPTLKGNLVELRPLRTDDYSSLYAVAADPLMWEQHHAKDRYKQAVFKEFFEEALNSNGALIAIDRSTREIIGSSRFYGYDQAESEVEIGWTFLARAYWGGVYNGEMKALMLGHAFQFVDNVVFLIGPENTRSRRAVEKIGAMEVGTRTMGDGTEGVVYRITAADFRPSTYTIELVKPRD